MEKMYAVVLYDSQIKKSAHPYAILVESDEFGGIPSYSSLKSRIDEHLTQNQEWDALVFYEVSESKTKQFNSIDAKIWPVLDIIEDKACVDKPEDDFVFINQVVKDAFDEQLQSEQDDNQKITEVDSRLTAILKQVGKAPLRSHVNAGCSLAFSIALLATASYLITQAVSVASVGFEVGAGLACAAFVACAVWAVFALMNYTHAKNTGHADDIKSLLKHRFCGFRNVSATATQRAQDPGQLDNLKISC